MEGKGSGNCCKFGTIVSILALLVAIAAYFCPKKEKAPSLDSGLDERIRSGVLDIIRQNPQLLMDAMGEGIAKKREDAVNQLAAKVLTQKNDIINKALCFGKTDSKQLVICFFDPMCKHCIEFQNSMIKLIKSGTNVKFAVLPVGVLGEDSVLLGKVYYAVYAKSPEKALAFIESVTSNGEATDKDAIEKALKVVGLSFKEIEPLLSEGDKKIASNGVMAEGLEVPVVPAIFISTAPNKMEMVQTTDAVQLAAKLDTSSAASGSDAVTTPEKIDAAEPDKNGKK
ncbi:MAG: thioredoxin domain-containing protein [Holosporales bacterium]|jgi:protein-disulfide isomerase|nr:thioredoxin domain-containing protein [Holosporales bacterium]